MDPSCLCKGLQVDPLPLNRGRDESIPHAPVRKHGLSSSEVTLAVRNALRYFPPSTHSILGPEFKNELVTYGHIYMYRFLPPIEMMHALPVDSYKTNIREAGCIVAMIMNNLDPDVAQFPQELVTYGGNGQVFSNWAQFWLVMKYLHEIGLNQTLVMYSGHPLGLFPSSPSAPLATVVNGMMIPNYSSKEMYDKLFGLNVTMYGQMTAGSWCYIGPQGIVHGTTLTIMNAGRKYLKTGNLTSRVFLSSGLGGMSGAQTKAASIVGCISIVAEIDPSVVEKRYKQGWVDLVLTDVDCIIERVKEAKKKKESVSIAYVGNVIDVWKRFVKEVRETNTNLVDLSSDQTSCHNPFNGGYYPEGLTFEQSNKLMASDPEKFKAAVESSLRTHIDLINEMTSRKDKNGNKTYFWDYGNAFLLQASRAGADVAHRSLNGDSSNSDRGNGERGEGERGEGETSDEEKSSSVVFRYPSYVQDVMGDIFSLGFGPFRWICMSQSESDLKQTDLIAINVLTRLIESGKNTLPEIVIGQYQDNLKWIKNASRHDLVVGSKARILYSDQAGRVEIASAFNQAIKSGELKGPVVISRDHHDVSGTDSPFRETCNITDGSNFTADMAVSNFIGDGIRGATWVALHNGGGVGWGEVMNGGFGLVLDGSDQSESKLRSVLNWDVSNGVARRSWSGNTYAKETIIRAMSDDPLLKVTIPFDSNFE